MLAAWAGLGYYARARNLHACARAVVAAGGFPRDLAGLRALPGIGEYTAAAVGAIAFGVPAVPVDGNVERVVARLFAVTEALPHGQADAARPGGAAGRRSGGAGTARPTSPRRCSISAPRCARRRAPACALCPWMAACAGRRAGIAADLPRKAAKRARPLRHGVHFWLTDADGNVLLRRRPPEGLLGGMTELPGTEWRAAPWQPEEALALAPMRAGWQPAGQVRHGFTHFELTIDLFAARVPRIEAPGFARPIAALAHEALPSVMRKCVRMAGTART